MSLPLKLRPPVFHIQDRTGIRYYSVPVEKGSQVGLKSIPSDFISCVIKINSWEEADERTAIVASACKGGGGDMLPMSLVRNRIRGVLGG
jgi:hypothetical protein